MYIKHSTHIKDPHFKFLCKCLLLLSSSLVGVFFFLFLLWEYRRSHCAVRHIIAWGITRFQFTSVQFSCSVVSDSLRPHESQHARPPCPSPTPGVYPNSCPSSWWCHPAIASSVVPFSSCPNPSQHQSLFPWVSSSHEVAKVLVFQLLHQSFQWTRFNICIFYFP